MVLIGHCDSKETWDVVQYEFNFSCVKRFIIKRQLLVIYGGTISSKYVLYFSEEVYCIRAGLTDKKVFQRILAYAYSNDVY